MGTRTLFLGLVAGALATGCGRPAAPAPEPPAAEPPRPVAVPISDRLAAPVPVTVDGVPLVRGGNVDLNPAFGDFDDPGRRAFLLGTAVPGDDGRLLVYRDLGPGPGVRLGQPQWFDDAVPTGRIKPG